MEDVVMVDINQVSDYLAGREFQEVHEDSLPFSELYEQIDETGNWYLKPHWQSVYDNLVTSWKEKLQGWDKQAIEKFMEEAL